MARNAGRAVRLIEIQHLMRSNLLGLTARELWRDYVARGD
jgi:hypothetical protein